MNKCKGFVLFFNNRQFLMPQPCFNLWQSLTPVRLNFSPNFYLYSLLIGVSSTLTHSRMYLFLPVLIFHSVFVVTLQRSVSPLLKEKVHDATSRPMAFQGNQASMSQIHLLGLPDPIFKTR